MGEIDDISLIDRYLNNQLAERELEQFHARLENDQEFNKLFEELRLLSQTLMMEKKKEVLHLLDRPNHAVSDDKTPTIQLLSKRKFIWYAAASILVLFSVKLLFFAPEQTDYLALFDSNYEVYPNLIHPIQRGKPDTISIEIQAFRAYEKENYQEAIDLFEQLQHYDSDLISFYLGNSYLAIKNNTKALLYYDKVSATGSTYYNQSLWYKGLTYLRMEEVETAKHIFESLDSGNSTYANKAKKILQEIN